MSRFVTVTRWECEDCGWPWPLEGDPPADAECDCCGGVLEPIDVDVAE